MSHKRVAILISGGGSNMMSLVNSMHGEHHARPVLVLSNRANAGGLVKAENAGITTAIVDHRPFKKDRAGFEKMLQDQLATAQIDIICLAGFMRILTPEFTAFWAGRMLNVHPSLLPKYRGLETHARALAAGEVAHGCTVHEVTGDLDDGPILGQARVKIQAGETAETLAATVLVQEHKLYPMVLERFARGIKTCVNI